VLIILCASALADLEKTLHKLNEQLKKEKGYE